MKQPRENFTFFWHGPFSQWHMCPVVIDGITYNCGEQYMMAQKAIFFKDDETLEKIMEAATPREQKGLGRAVKNFNKPLWDEYCLEVVYRANLEKFSQHSDLKQMLLDTKNTIMVEASPYDTIWGVGMGEGNPDICDPEKWNGLNLLGKTLNKVREALLDD